MSGAAPSISVVMPTRNRARLLRFSLATARGQTAGDLEIVVSDNDSSDGTRELVEGVGDDRVRYVHTGRTLSQPESWEFAFAQARGEWLILLADDDGIVPTLFERLLPLIEEHRPRLIAWRKCWYIHPGLDPPWPYPEEENKLSVHPCTGRVEEVEGREQLRRFFRREERGPIPGDSNALFHRDALDRLRGAAGRLFSYPDPAAFACAGLLALERSYLTVDLPLTVEGISRVNVSAGYRHEISGTHRVVQEYQAEAQFTEVPLRSRTMNNSVFESLLRAKHALPDAMAGIELDPVRYFVRCYCELTDPGQTADRTADLEEWRAVLRRQSWAVRVAVARELARHRTDGLLRRAYHRAAGRVPALRSLRRSVRRRVEGRSDFLRIDGAEGGFSDLAGAARYLDAHLLPAIEASLTRA